MFERLAKIWRVKVAAQKAVVREVNSQKGTALLVALLIMGVLTAVSLAVSSLIIKEIGITRLAVDSGRAYYAAESGVEVALLQLEENLPGYEVEDGSDGGLFELVDGADVSYSIANTANEYPYLDPDKYDAADAPATVYYNSLDLNESITIPLFTVDELGTEKSVTDFRVYYYVDFRPEDLNFSFDISGWDVLRWKIYGIKEYPASGVYRTESINDFTAVVVTTDDESTNAGTPTWFGSSVDCEDNLHEGAIECHLYDVVSDPIHVETEEGFDIFTGVCLPWQAMEYYFYEDGKVEDVVDCYPIQSFLAGHKHNYMTLTNLMNPSLFNSSFSKEKRIEKSKVYFRVEVYKDGQIIREYADISSTGVSGDSKVKLNVLKKRGSYLPVFNFALYHTAE